MNKVNTAECITAFRREFYMKLKIYICHSEHK